MHQSDAFISRREKTRTVSNTAWFIDATQIVLPRSTLNDHRDALEDQFMITVVNENNTVRIIGSPVAITEVTAWLSRRGIAVQ